MRLQSEHVVIIGGGIIGAAIAYYLCKRGVNPLIIERDCIVSGASRANGGNVLLQDKLPGPTLDLAKSSFALYRKLLQELDCDVGYVQTSGLLVAETEQDWEILSRHAHSLQTSGISINLIDSDELRRQERLLARDLCGATECPEEFKVNPILLTMALLLEARESGARILEGTEVRGFHQTNGKLTAVRTSRGDVATECAVIAAGVWSAEIAATLHVSIPVKPRKGQMLVTEVWPDAPKRTMLAAGYLTAKYVAAPDKGSADAAQPTGDFTCSKTKEGNCLIGSRREFAGYTVQNTPEALRSVASRACRFIPSLREIKVIRAFAGLRPFSPDHRPCLGPVEQVPGLFVATGHEGEGITLAPITGKLVADAILGTGKEELERFLPSRFAFGSQPDAAEYRKGEKQ